MARISRTRIVGLILGASCVAAVFYVYARPALEGKYALVEALPSALWTFLWGNATLLLWYDDWKCWRELGFGDRCLLGFWLVLPAPACVGWELLQFYRLLPGTGDGGDILNPCVLPGSERNQNMKKSSKVCLSVMLFGVMICLAIGTSRAGAAPRRAAGVRRGNRAMKPRYFFLFLVLGVALLFMFPPFSIIFRTNAEQHRIDMLSRKQHELQQHYSGLTARRYALEQRLISLRESLPATDEDCPIQSTDHRSNAR